MEWLFLLQKCLVPASFLKSLHVLGQPAYCRAGKVGKLSQFSLGSDFSDLPLELCLAEGPKLQGLREGTSRIYPNFIIAEHLLV